MVSTIFIAQHLQESTFYIYLPVEGDSSRNRKVAACLKTKRPAKLIKILLVFFQT